MTRLGLLLMATLPGISGQEPGPSTPLGAGWEPLWNGKDLSGWETYLKRKRGPDPKAVFTVAALEDGAAIRISGEIEGGLLTQGVYGNYHFRAEFKWGSKKWPPRENEGRDSGVHYHCLVPLEKAGIMSLQCGVAERDSGDFWNAGMKVDVEGDPVDLSAKDVPGLEEWKQRNGMTSGRGLRYRPGAPIVSTDGWIMKSVSADKPVGQWNLVEVFTHGQTSVHVINGKANLVLRNTRHGDAPLAQGRIMLQSEFAEVYFRKVEIQALDEIPKQYVK